METAYVLINCDLGTELPIINSLKQMKSVKEIHGIFGAFDIITKLENQDRDEIRKTVIENIRKLEHVRSTLTLMGVKGQS